MDSKWKDCVNGREILDSPLASVVRPANRSDIGPIWIKDKRDAVDYKREYATPVFVGPPESVGRTPGPPWSKSKLFRRSKLHVQNIPVPPEYPNSELDRDSARFFDQPPLEYEARIRRHTETWSSLGTPHPEDNAIQAALGKLYEPTTRLRGQQVAKKLEWTKKVWGDLFEKIASRESILIPRENVQATIEAMQAPDRFQIPDGVPRLASTLIVANGPVGDMASAAITPLRSRPT